MNLFTGTGKVNQDESNDIDRSEFNNGYALAAEWEACGARSVVQPVERIGAP